VIISEEDSLKFEFIKEESLMLTCPPFFFVFVGTSILVRSGRDLAVKLPGTAGMGLIIYPDNFPRSEPYWSMATVWKENARARKAEEDDNTCSGSKCSIF